jgi:hypothetical protein
MKCEICGSKKNVKCFYGPIENRFYTECRACYEKAMLRCPSHITSKANLEKIWDNGFDKKPF